jgi:site-specific DNA-methyltransferase (adenine-specific)
MKDISNNSIDLIICDPPYNIGKDTWDKIKNYESWCIEWIKECQRILKKNGSFYLFHNNMSILSRLLIDIEEKTDFKFRQFIVWNKKFNGSKNEGFLQGFNEVENLRNFQKMAEYIVFYTLQDETGLTTINHDINNYSSLRKYFKELQENIGLNLKKINNRLGHRKAEHCFYWNTTQWSLPIKEIYDELIRVFNIHEWIGFREYESLRLEYESLRLEYESLRYKFNNLKTHHSIWNYEIATKIGHVTPKPTELIENIILHSSCSGDLILDPFSGSGTTAIACINTKRDYICIEKDDNYFSIMEERIKNHRIQTVLS